MASPQTENGHIDIANELAEALAKIRISGEEMQCLWVIFRKTYGWHKKQDAISLSQFVEMTGIVKPHVVRALDGLLSKKIITVTYIGNEPAKVYGINKDYEKWIPLPKKVTLPIKVISVTKKGNPSLPKKVTTKETTTKEKKETTTAETQKAFFDFNTGEFTGLNGKVEIWVKAYPAIDVLAEIKKAGAWLVANPKNRKSDYPRFLNGWLSRAQNRAPKVTSSDGPFKSAYS